MVDVEEVEEEVAVEERNSRKSAYLNSRLGEEVEVVVVVHSLYALVDRILDVRVRQYAVSSNYDHISVVLEHTARRRA